MAALEKYIPQKPETPRRVVLAVKMDPEVKVRFDEIREELGITQAALLQAMIDRTHDEFFE